MFEKPIILTDKMIIIIKKYVWVRLPNQCWPWRGSRDKDGYGQLSINTESMIKTYKAHRVAYVITYKEFDWSLQVCHNCDNPPCCNPSHLFLGTNLDNQRDSSVKGRCVRASGENHGMSNLTKDDIAKIRFKHSLGIEYADLAKEFNTSIPTINRIVNYRTWKYIL